MESAETPRNTPRRDVPLAATVLRFARVLRRAGLPVGPGKVLDAIQAVRTVGVADRGEFYWTLHAVLVNRPEQRALFDQVFQLFWRSPQVLQRLASVCRSEGEFDDPVRLDFSGARLPPAGTPSDPQTVGSMVLSGITPDAAAGWSAQERLRHKAFENMSAREIAEAKAAIAEMRLPEHHVLTRRFTPYASGPRIDLRASLRTALRRGPDTMALVRKRRRQRPAVLVLLCDISGSMSCYSRMLLHFIHAVSNARERVHVFVFGTRLSNVTRSLKEKDVDRSLDRVARAVEDWSGGTRIGESLRQFNRLWSRRVLAQGAIVLFISDGLDRGAGVGLECEVARLRRSCRRLIWLNPLLRFQGFEPRSRGMRAILPHVDELRAIHNLQSMVELCAALAGPCPTPAGRTRAGV